MGYSPWGHKESDMTERLFTLIPWVGKIPWRREWQPTPVLLPEEFHGQKTLVGYSPWVTKSHTQLSD